VDILDDMGVSKLSAKVFLKVNYSFKTIGIVYSQQIVMLFRVSQDPTAKLPCCLCVYLQHK